MRRALLTVHKFFPEHRAGTEVLTLKIAQELQRRNYEVLVVTANPPDLDARYATGPNHLDYVHDGVNVHQVGEALRLRGYTFSHEYWHPAVALHIGKVAEKFKPDFIQMMHAQNVSAAVIEESKRRQIPIILSPTDFWYVCPVVQLKRPDGAICEGPSYGATNCLTCYTPELFPPQHEFKEALEQRKPQLAAKMKSLPLSGVVESLAYNAYLASKLPSAIGATVKRPGILRDAANKADAITVATKLMRNLFIKNGINGDLIHQIPFGIDTSPLEPYQTKTPSETLRIGFIGTLFEHKGVDVLIKAFQDLPKDAKVSLTIYGDPNQFPDYFATLKTLAEKDKNALSKMTFGGTFPNQRLGEVLTSIDVLVVPSRWYENTPLVIQSALATKTPVIVTDLGGMSELIQEDVNGMLFPLNDYKTLSQKFQRILNEPRLLERLRNNIKPERTTSQMMDDIEVLYDKILGAKSATVVH